MQYVLNIKEIHTDLLEKKKSHETNYDQDDHDVDTLEEIGEESDETFTTASFSAAIDAQSSEVVSLIQRTASIESISNDDKEFQ